MNDARSTVGSFPAFQLVWRLTLALIVMAVLVPAPALAHDPGEGTLPEILASATFDQRLGEQVPLDLVFRDESGQSVSLDDLVRNRPVVLTLNYYRCDSLCPLVMDGAAAALKLIPFTLGEDYDLVTVSIDSRESPADARKAKEELLARHDYSGANENWHVLTGDQEMIDALALAVGFNYAWDESGQQFAHPSGLIVLGPTGKVARYIYGTEFNPRDLRLALVESSENKIGSPVDDVLLFCFRYDPAIGKYSSIAFGAVRAGGILTIMGLAFFIGTMLQKDRQSPQLPGATG